ncbi:beta-ketoacyl-[acyl-carrier-protein] synthase family protein [Actinophytocola oryzae]|uniref:3-oxoacyl-[acyl-carrier-protein] synthase II n=1 Tax=Actinophytocola oryzae TaxID=502181 RepID=A0A4R7USC5_9PSEU|nr:beta-ketoacyl-[acyl-carrier-protein] synthase family protein [Actinophytocola oryzae]TDV37789.1 3-oxoacyl-[acyl-carrier-protein] synthase II [Actinophytocola oryzae]
MAEDRGRRLDSTPCVTGMAFSTPLGDDIEAVWQRLLDGQHGFRKLAERARLRSELVAMVPDVDPDLPPAERQLVLSARSLRAALADAGVAPDDPGVRLVLGTSYGDHLDTGADSLYRWAAASAERIGHPHEPLSVTTACSAASDSIAVGAEMIRSGQCEICVCGGADIVTLAKRLGHSALGTMTADTLRAFDANRSGMLLGEGAAFLVLESLASARGRAAPIHAVLRGWGSSNDAHGMTAPDPAGHSVTAAIRRSLSGSGLTRSDVAVVSAHGTGTPVNDAVEAASLTAVFADQAGPVVYATKGALGHSLGACGAIEAVTLIVALRDHTVPPVCNLVTPMPGSRLRLPDGRPLGFDGSVGISLTLGFGGFNTALLFSGPEYAHD